MLSIQPLGLHSSDEELRSVGVLTGIGHRQITGSEMLQNKVLVRKLLAVDRPAASSEEINHKLGFSREVSGYPSPLVKSPPWSMKFLMTRWKALPLYPSGLVLVASVAKFSTVLGTMSPNSPISILPAAAPPMVMSKKTAMEKGKRKERKKVKIWSHLSWSPWDHHSGHQLCCCNWR